MGQLNPELHLQMFTFSCALYLCNMPLSYRLLHVSYLQSSCRASGAVAARSLRLIVTEIGLADWASKADTMKLGGGWTEPY